MTHFRGRGTMMGRILSTLVFLTAVGLLHFLVGRAFWHFLLPEERLGFAALLVLTFGFVATFRLAASVRLAQAMRRRWVGVDEDGIEWTDGQLTLHASWDEVEEVRVNFLRIRDRVASYVTVTTRAGERVSLSHHFQGRVQETREGRPHQHAVLEVEMTPFLLYLLRERAGLSEVEPYVWRRGTPAVVVVEDPILEEPLSLGAQLRRFCTPVQAGLALGSLLFYVSACQAGNAMLKREFFEPWKTGLGVLALLLIHELGHVWAMVRSGMRVRGIFFVPPLGAVTVPETLWKDRDAQAYTAISGPLWGALSSAVLVVLWSLTKGRWPILLVVVMLNCSLNLFNLLPIAPLDGARLLGSILNSVSPRLGLGVGAGVILATVVCAMCFGGFPLWFLAIIAVVFGGFEVVYQYAAAIEAEKVRRVCAARGSAWTREVAALGDMLAVQSVEEYAWVRTGGAPRRRGKWMRWQQVLGCAPMSRGRLALYIGMYVLLAATMTWAIHAAGNLLALQLRPSIR